MRTVVSTLLLLLIVQSCTACGAQYSAMFSRYLKDGLAELDQERFADAENSLALAVRQSNHQAISDADRILALRSLGVCQQMEGKHLHAISSFEKVLHLLAKKNQLMTVQYAEVLEDAGISYCKLQMYPQASRVLNDALAIYESHGLKDPKLGRVLQSLAFSHRKCGNNLNAAKAYSRYFASQNLSKQNGNKDLMLLQDYREILGKMHNKIELAKTDVYLKKLSSKA